jgi:eukaryotic-like serine/threonine-protein kinase
VGTPDGDEPLGGFGQLGNYQLVERLGRGGMAEVYKARAVEGPKAGQEFALKRMLPELESDPEYVAMFAGEADLIRFLDHPNIVKVHEVGSTGAGYFLVMELIDGRDGGQIVKRCRERKIPWPIDFAVYLTRVLLEALAYAHAAAGPTGKPLGIVHCDVSPSNLFISRTGDIKLGDFGVARGLIDSGAAEVMGKPYYLSPETLGGIVSPATDLWAATVTLFELLTLQRPFTGRNPDEVFARVRAGERPSVVKLRPEVSPALAAVIDRGFAPDQAARFPDAGTYAKALTPLYDERVGTPLAISAVVRGLFPTEQ